MSHRAITGLVAGLVALGVLWLIRPVFHGIVLFFFVNPLVWLPPLAVLVIWGVTTTLAGARDPWAQSRTPAVMARYPRQSLRGSSQGNVWSS